MEDDEDFLILTRTGFCSPGEAPYAGDSRALESLRDEFWSFACSGGALSEVVGILKKMRGMKPNFGDCDGTESRIAFYHRLSIKQPDDLYLLDELLALQRPQRRRDLREVPRLVEEVLKVECNLPEDQRQRLRSLARLAHLTHSPDWRVFRFVFDECLKLETWDAELEDSLLDICRCSWSREKPECAVVKRLLLRHFAAAESADALTGSNINARWLEGICEASEVVSVAEEIFRVQKKVPNYYATKSPGARPLSARQRLKHLAWNALRLAELYFDVGRFDDAEKICLQAIDWYAEGAGAEAKFSEKVGLFGLRIHLSKFRIAQGKFEEAKPDLIEVLTFADPLTEDDYADSDVYRPWSGARVLLARVYVQSGEPDKAEKLLLRVKEEPGFPETGLPGLPEAISDLKALYETAARPDYDGKLKSLLEFETELHARQLRQQREMDYNSLEGSFINAYPWLDLMTEGRDYIKSLRAFGSSISMRIQHLCDLAEKCLYFDQYQLGMEAIDEALLQFGEPQEAGCSDSLLAKILHIRAHFFMSEGKFSDAESDLAEVQKILQPHAKDYQFGSGDLGVLDLEVGRYEDAERRLSEACGALSKTRHTCNHLANLYFYLGYLKLRRSDLTGAREELERAAKLLKQNLEKQRDEMLRLKVISLLAVTYQGIGMKKEASTIMQYAVDSGGVGATRNLVWILLNAGTLAENRGEQKRAARYFGEAQSLIDELGLSPGLLVQLVREAIERVK